MNNCKYLKRDHAEKLVKMLKDAAPYDTGALHSKIELVQIDANGFVVVVGTPGDVQGREPSKYAWFTEYQNRSAGWIKRTCELWARKYEPIYNIQASQDIDEEEEM